jgi:hypothetical protein
MKISKHINIHVTNEMGQIWIFSWIFKLKTGFFLTTRISMRVWHIWFKESILPSKSLNDYTFYDFFVDQYEFISQKKKKIDK